MGPCSNICYLLVLCIMLGQTVYPKYVLGDLILEPLPTNLEINLSVIYNFAPIVCFLLLARKAFYFLIFHYSKVIY